MESNISIGAGSGNALTSSESNNVLISDSGVIGKSNLFIASIPGGDTFISNYGTPADNTTFQGRGAGNKTLTIGSSQNNTGSGANNLGVLTTGAGNSGYGSLNPYALTSGINNSCLGFGSGGSLVSGSYNLLLGYNSGSQLNGVESHNIYASNVGVTGESYGMRLGTTGSGNGQVNKTFIAGARGVTTTNANAINVLIDSAGQLGTISSSIRFKENVETMSNESNFLYNLRPVTFDYKNHSSMFKSVGLIAEEVELVAPLIAAHDEFGQALSLL